MKISKLVKELNKFKKEHGDVETLVIGTLYSEPVSELEIVEGKDTDYCLILP